MLMAVTPSSDENNQSAVLPPTERRCLVSGGIKPKEQMIRFVVGPDGAIVPDVAGKLPGRGLWVDADRALISQAIAKNLFSKAAKKKVLVSENTLELTQRLLAKRCLDLLGLAKSAGAVVTGQPQIEDALSKGALSSVLLANDAGNDCRKKLSRAIVTTSGFSRFELGEALGHAHLASVGLRIHPLTRKLEAECGRWQKVKGDRSVLTREELDSERT